MENTIKWSKKVQERDNRTCQFCGTQTEKLHSHHIVPKHLNRDLEHEVENGLTLCTVCHQEWHNIDRNYLIISDIMNYLNISEKKIPNNFYRLWVIGDIF